jgi:hypothetical protein
MPKHVLTGLVVTIALLLTLSGCRSTPAVPEEIPNAGSGQLRVGDTAPDFTLPEPPAARCLSHLCENSRTSCRTSIWLTGERLD